jgi:Na+/H+ antiporter NhaD/arsenite permease-like protein
VRLRRRPLSIATIALLCAVVVLLLCVFLAVYRPAALALAGATFIVILTWLSDRRERARRARLRAAAAPPPVPVGPPQADRGPQSPG